MVRNLPSYERNIKSHTNIRQKLLPACQLDTTGSYPLKLSCTENPRQRREDDYSCDYSTSQNQTVNTCSDILIEPPRVSTSFQVGSPSHTPHWPTWHNAIISTTGSARSRLYLLTSVHTAYKIEPTNKVFRDSTKGLRASSEPVDCSRPMK
jgi:hypothetical protein